MRVWPALLIEAPGVGDPPDAEELVSALLDDYAPQAIEDLVERPLPPGGLWDPTYPPPPEPPPSPLRWRVFFATAASRAAAGAALSATLPRLRLTAVDIPDDDWAARSQQHLTGVTAGRFIVAPPWDRPATLDDHQVLIIIEPSMGFGTGHHATTRLCLRLVSGLDLRGRRVVDLGTGSGVLAMAAALSGAAAVEALDVDPDAIQSAQASAALNDLPPVVRFTVGDFRTSPPAAADVVLANLTGGMLRTAAETLRSIVAPGGTLVASGFDTTEAPAVLAALGPGGVAERLDEDGWVGVRLTFER